MLSCKKELAEKQPSQSDDAGSITGECSNARCALDRIYQKDGHTYLYAGTNSSTHFNITGWLLESENLRDHGLSREAFPALIAPLYQPLSEIPALYRSNSQVLVVKGRAEVRAYPYSLMTYHEVINDEIDGKPYMAAYCVLADFTAAYSRQVCDRVLTFAVSGYTYLNPNFPDDPIQAFILWDRETESLWNPLTDAGVSHLLQNQALAKLPVSQWEVMTWSELKDNYPAARVLKVGQQPDPPLNWPRLSCSDLSCCH